VAPEHLVLPPQRKRHNREFATNGKIRENVPGGIPAHGRRLTRRKTKDNKEEGLSREEEEEIRKKRKIKEAVAVQEEALAQEMPSRKR